MALQELAAVREPLLTNLTNPQSLLPGCRAWKTADFIAEGQIVEVKTSGGCRAKLFFYRGNLNVQRSWETLKRELRGKHLCPYLVLHNKTLVIVCDFKVKLFGKMGSRHASTSRRCYACCIIINLESGAASHSLWMSTYSYSPALFWGWRNCCAAVFGDYQFLPYMTYFQPGRTLLLFELGKKKIGRWIQFCLFPATALCVATTVGKRQTE